eukprot:3114394-Rhodomonas_salina.1
MSRRGKKRLANCGYQVHIPIPRGFSPALTHGPMLPGGTAYNSLRIPWMKSRSKGTRWSGVAPSASLGLKRVLRGGGGENSKAVARGAGGVERESRRRNRALPSPISLWGVASAAGLLRTIVNADNAVADMYGGNCSAAMHR